ncbi:MAG: hypothetical protein JHC31_04540 [Sulfurihydrogenibium sp.]|jgi:hypothetical protein|nr:hypothetical protein [Sulfurihydrogenibium sp.]
MEFTSWYMGDLYNTVTALSNMSSSMISSVVNILFLFVVFLLLFRAYMSFANKHYKSVAVNILYVFILGFLFLGKGKYYLNYVNITGFTEDDSARLDNPANMTTPQYKVAGEQPGQPVQLPSNNIQKVSSTPADQKQDPFERQDTVKFLLTGIPNVYAIPAFMDEIAVSLATAAGLSRDGDYYTLAVMQDPKILFNMTANQMLHDALAGQKSVALCKFYRTYATCFNSNDFEEIETACKGINKDNRTYSRDVTITDDDCKQMVTTFGSQMQKFLDSTLGNPPKNSTYQKIYNVYSSMAKGLQQGKFQDLPPDVKRQIQASLYSALNDFEMVARQKYDENAIARALTDPIIATDMLEWFGAKVKSGMAELGKSWLVTTMLIQNELVIYLSFFLLPLVVLITFLTNNFKYLAEYSFGYLLLKLQLPLWVIGHYLATGHVFSNLVADPSVNGFLISLSNRGISDSILLVNTITAGITSLGIGSLFLFGKSAAGGVQQGVAAGSSILAQAIEGIGAIIAVGSGVAAGGAALAGGLSAGVSGTAVTAAGSAAGSAAGGVIGFGNVGGIVANLSRSAIPLLNRAGYNVGKLLSKTPMRQIFHKGGEFSVNASTNVVEKMRFGDQGALNAFLNQQRDLGRRATREVDEQTGDESIIISVGRKKAIYKKVEDGSWHLENKENDENNFALKEEDIIGKHQVKPPQ